MNAKDGWLGVMPRSWRACSSAPSRTSSFLELLDREHAELPLPAEMFVRSLVHLLWHGVEPPSRPSRSTPSKKKPPRKERVR